MKFVDKFADSIVTVAIFILFAAVSIAITMPLMLLSTFLWIVTGVLIAISIIYSFILWIIKLIKRDKL